MISEATNCITVVQFPKIAAVVGKVFQKKNDTESDT